MGAKPGEGGSWPVVDLMLGDSAHWSAGQAIAGWKSVGLRAAHLGTLS